MNPGAKTIDEYLLPRIKVVESGCWEWQGVLTHNGYGTGIRDTNMGNRYKQHRVHRLSYAAYIGKIPKNMSVLHKCDNRKCCNPEHLFLGTNEDNVKDKIAKGRLYMKPKQYNWELVCSYHGQLSSKSVAKLLGMKDRTIRRIWHVNGLTGQFNVKEINLKEQEDDRDNSRYNSSSVR